MKQEKRTYLEAIQDMLDCKKKIDALLAQINIEEVRLTEYRKEAFDLKRKEMFQPEARV